MQSALPATDTVVPPSGFSERPFCPESQRKFVLISAILASALGFIDGSVLAIAIPAIRVDLGASLVEAQWISNAYALTLSALILAGGTAGDRFGLRRVFAMGITFFVAASLACVVAPNPAILIVCRAVQGIGAAIMVPCSLAIIAKAYPKSERGRAIGIWAAASALTTSLGPILGGLVLSAFGDAIWRGIFAINLPLGGLAIYLLLAKVPNDVPTEKRSLDLGGAALTTLAFGSMAYGLTSLSNESSDGQTSQSLLALVGGFLVLVAFVWWERRQREPMIELGLFANRAFSGANIVTFFLYFSLSAVLFYLPMLLIAGWGLDTAVVGFTFVPLSAAIAVLSGPVGKLADRVGPRFPIAVGSLLVAVAFAGSAVTVGMGIRHFWLGIFPFMVIMGIGMALVVSPLSTAVMTSVEDRDTGAASGINNAVSRIGGLMAVAAMGSIAAWAYAWALGPLAGDGIPGFGEPLTGTIGQDLDMARIAASNFAFSVVAWVTAGLCLVSALVAWMTAPGSALPWQPRVEGAQT